MSTTRLARRLAAVACSGVLLVVLAATGAFGSFQTSVTSAGTPVSTGTLLPPSNLSTSYTCNGKSGKATVTITWTISPSTIAAGHKVNIVEGATPTLHIKTPRTVSTDSYTTTSVNTTSVTVTVWSFVQGWSSSTVSTSQAISCP